VRTGRRVHRSRPPRRSASPRMGGGRGSSRRCFREPLGKAVMQITDLRIENFRGIRNGYVRFRPHTVFVGPNNCGKTTVIEALALLFGRDRLVRTLTEHDFYGSNPQPADRIRLIATIIDFEGDDPTDHTEWFRDDRAVPKWWDPLSGHASATRDDPT